MPKTVYVGPASRVYHTNAKCRYLQGEAKRTTDVAAQKKGIAKLCAVCQSSAGAETKKTKT